MKLKLYYELIKSFYKRMAAQNIITVIIFIISNITTNTALTFYVATNNIKDEVAMSYFEYKSIGISEVRQVAANNDLLTLSQYRRPEIATLYNMMDRIGHFEIKPDYGAFLNNGRVEFLGLEVDRPEFVVHQKNEVGINMAFYNVLKQNFAVDVSDLQLVYRLNEQIELADEVFKIIINKQLTMTFIYEEINYFSIPKLYLPQNIVDNFLGDYYLAPNLTVANLIYNLPNDHALTNRRYRLHFQDEAIYKTFIRNVLKIDNEISYEFSGDDYEKGELFAALFSYLRILVIVFLVLVIIGVLLITVMITNAFIDKNKPQIALFQLFNDKSLLPYILFALIYFFNFGLSFMSKPLLLLIYKLANNVIWSVLGLRELFTFSNDFFLLVYAAIGILNLLLLLSVMLIKLRKPVLSTLLAYD